MELLVSLGFLLLLGIGFFCYCLSKIDDDFED